MAQIIISPTSKFRGRAPVMVNGKLYQLPVGVAFEPEAGITEALNNGGVAYTTVATQGAATGKIILSDATGKRFPISVNGKARYLETGVPITVTAEERAALDNIGNNYTPEYSTGASLIISADFVAGTFSLNGVPCTEADIFDAEESDWIDRPGIGKSVVKAVGTGTTEFHAYGVFTPAARAAFNTASGFTAIISQTLDQLVASGASYPSAGSQMLYETEVGFKQVFAGKEGASYHLLVGQETVDPEAEDFDMIDPVTGVGLVHSYAASFAHAVHGYFLDNVATGGTADDFGAVDLPMPIPGEDIFAVIGLTAEAKLGTAGEKNGVSSRTTINSVKFYSPAQGAGWTPPA